MRISPLGIFGANFDLRQVAEWAQQDAAITHPNPVCGQVNALFAMALAHTVWHGPKPKDLFHLVEGWASDLQVDKSVQEAIDRATKAPASDYMRHQGWVLMAFRNALWQLLNAKGPEEGVVDTVMRGGDTDTNAAICGSLLGAVYGREAIPAQWTECLMNCRPADGQTGVRRPRPEAFWPADVLLLAEGLITRAEQTA